METSYATGARLEVSGHVLSADIRFTPYGTSTDIRILCLDGTLVRWDASHRLEYTPGDEITVRGTVKGLSPFDKKVYVVLTQGRVMESALFG